MINGLQRFWLGNERTFVGALNEAQTEKQEDHFKITQIICVNATLKLRLKGD